MKLRRVEKVDEEFLKEIVERLLKVVTPTKIILFGSYVYGKPKRGSDLDILVVVDNLENSRRDLRLRIRKALREFLIAKDIIVTTNQDIEEWKDVHQAFITSVMRKGKVIYEG